MARKKKPPEHVNHERWLVSYADFITLLFAFFVVMFATAATKPEKVEEFVTSVREAFDSYGIYVGVSESRVMGPPETSGSPKITIEVEDAKSGLGGVVKSGAAAAEQLDEKDFETTSDKEPAEEDIHKAASDEPTPEPTMALPEGVPTPFSDEEEQPSPTPEEGEGDDPAVTEGSPDLSKVFTELKNLLAKELEAYQIEMKQEKRGIVISLKEAGFFDSASADLKPKSLEILNRIAVKLAALPKPCTIRVEGHTDNEPLTSNSRYRDNLELSCGRANSVIAYMVRQHHYNPGQMVASGYGEWRPIAPNATEEGRARNRRVDIVLLNEESTRQEPPAPAAGQM